MIGNQFLEVPLSAPANAKIHLVSIVRSNAIKGVHNAFELWAPFIFCVKVLACGHSAKPSAVIDGILGVVG